MRKKILLRVVALMSILTMWVTSALAQPSTATVYLDPSEIIFDINETPVGHRFNVTAWVSNVTDLFGYQAAIYYDNTTLDLISASNPFEDSEWVFYGQVGLPVAGLGNFSYLGTFWGYGLSGYSLLPFDTPTTFNGTGKLAIFEFEIIASPPNANLTSPLIISENPGPPELFDTKLKNSTGGAINFTATDGYVTIIPELPSFLILPILAILTLAALVLAKKPQRKPRVMQ